MAKTRAAHAPCYVIPHFLDSVLSTLPRGYAAHLNKHLPETPVAALYNFGMIGLHSSAAVWEALSLLQHVLLTSQLGRSREGTGTQLEVKFYWGMRLI